jgi:hypothetical protein
MPGSEMHAIATTGSPTHGVQGGAFVTVGAARPFSPETEA